MRCEHGDDRFNTLPSTNRTVSDNPSIFISDKCIKTPSTEFYPFLNEIVSVFSYDNSLYRSGLNHTNEELEKN